MTKLLFPHHTCNLVLTGPAVSDEMSSENVDDDVEAYTDDRRRTTAYTISFPGAFGELKIPLVYWSLPQVQP